MLTIYFRLSPSSPLAKPITFTASDTLKLALTTKDGKSGVRPHQAFLTFTEQDAGLEESFPISVKDNGKAKLDLVGALYYCKCAYEADTIPFRLRKIYPTSS